MNNTTACKCSAEKTSSSSVGRPRINLLDWIFTIPFLVAFSACLVLLDPCLRLARRLNRKIYERVVVLLSRGLLFSMSITGAKINLQRAEELIGSEPLLLVSNHQSLMDIPMINVLFSSKLPRFISKTELARGIPFVSYHLRHGEHALINRSDKTRSVGEIQALAQRMLEKQLAVAIFPEGTRARDGKFKPFKKAGLLVLLKQVPGVRIVPVVIDGSWRFAYYKLFPVPRGLKITARTEKSIRQEEGESLNQLCDRIHHLISESLSRMRLEEAG